MGQGKCRSQLGRNSIQLTFLKFTHRCLVYCRSNWVIGLWGAHGGSKKPIGNSPYLILARQTFQGQCQSQCEAGLHHCREGYRSQLRRALVAVSPRFPLCPFHASRKEHMFNGIIVVNTDNCYHNIANIKTLRVIRPSLNFETSSIARYADRYVDTARGA